MIHYDCRHYVGRKPCQFKRTCDGCNHYDQVKERILVIKLGALGDLLRTTTILPALKKAHPRAQITWATTSDCIPLLQNLPQIDRIWATDAHITARILAEKFDLMLNFDKDTPAAELATLSQANVKKGFALNSRGELIALNPSSQYSLELGIDDELKFRKNQKTYQQLIHEMVELEMPSPAPEYQLKLTAREIQFGKEWMQEQLHQKDKHFVLAINPGCGKVFATKKWQSERYLELAIRLHQEHQIIPVLLGGSDESQLIDSLFKALKKARVPVLRPGEDLTLRQFASIVAQCDGLISGDTLAMHIGLAMGLRTVTLFTSTCVQEIEMYGRGKAIVGKAPCAPCYLSHCKQASQWCAENISVDQVFEAVTSHMELSSFEKVRRRSHL